MERSDWMHRTVCRCGVAQLVLIACLSAANAATAEEAVIARASTGRAAREDAIRGIPFQNISRQAGSRLAAVVRNPTMFRRMPISVIECDPEMHRFLVRYPEVVVNVWQLMGITKVSATRVAPYQLDCSDGVGTLTDMELIYGDHDTHVILCEGSYEGPLFRKPMTGRCVLVLKSGLVKSDLETYQITNRLDVFVQVDHAGVDIFARTLHPLLGKSADINFLESMKFLQRMSHAAEKNGAGMEHLASRLDQVDDEVREKFRQVVANVNARHEHRLASRGETGDVLSLNH